MPSIQQLNNGIKILIYLGIQDSYEIPDIGCESALTKIYCTENMKICVDSCLEILGMAAYSKLNEIQKRYMYIFRNLINHFD